MHPDLPLRRECAGRQAALDRKNLRVRRYLLETEGRLPLPHLQVHFRNPVPVNENIGAGKFNPIGIGHSSCFSCRHIDAFQGGDGGVTLLQIALNFEVELLGEIARQGNAGAAQSNPILQCRCAETAFEGGDIATFNIRLNISAEGELVLRAAGVHIYRRRRRRGKHNFVGVSRHSLFFRLRQNRSEGTTPGLELLYFFFQLGVALLQLPNCFLEILQPLIIRWWIGRTHGQNHAGGKNKREAHGNRV